MNVKLINASTVNIITGGNMFKKLMSLFSSKRESKKSIGFGFEEPNEDYKFSHVHESFSMWCESTSLGEDCEEGHKERFNEGARNKHIFVKRAEMKKWRFINGHWYCPACAKEKK